MVQSCGVPQRRGNLELQREPNRGLLSLAIVVIVMWPVMLWLIGLGVAMIARLGGCSISAHGPEPCLRFGVDQGGALYPLFGLGLYLIYALLWIPLGLGIVGLIRWLSPVWTSRQRRGASRMGRPRARRLQQHQAQPGEPGGDIDRGAPGQRRALRRQRHGGPDQAALRRGAIPVKRVAARNGSRGWYRANWV